MDLVRDAEAYIRKYHMIEQGDFVVAGVSGGADSVCLLLVLDALQTRLGFHLAAVHVNHNLRGQAADEDEAYVRMLCRERDIPLYVYSYPVREIAKSEKKGLEETGRLLRQKAFYSALDAFASVRNMSGTDQTGRKVALAHHANDLAETVLFQAARGSSLAGLAGIRPVSLLESGSRGHKLMVIHPLLFALRRELEAWLVEKGIVWRTDATNQDEEYARNGLRNRVIPYLEEHINEAVVRHIRDLSEDAAQADAYLHTEAARREEKMLEVHPDFTSGYGGESLMTAASGVQDAGAAGSVLIRDTLTLEPEVLQRYILMDALTVVTGKKKDLGREQLRQLQVLFSLSAGRRMDLPYGVRAVRTYDGVELQRKTEDIEAEYGGPARSAESNGRTEEVPVPVRGNGVCRFGAWKFTCAVKERTPGAMQKIPPNRYTKRFDYDKMGTGIVFRTRRPGDRMVVTVDGKTKKLKDYFINEKIPRDERDRIPLLASGETVFWVVGGRISEDCKISENTVRVLEIIAERVP
ncbi:MAG: tRNA lysidine(34) synthetase TilS [Bilifractor sp.]